MILGLTTIQRNRGRWLAEWFAFHHMVGFNKFYFYAHMCTDNTFEILNILARKLEIVAITIPDVLNQVQLVAYQHACQNYMNDVDWMGFIDGDEFLFPTQCDSFHDALIPYNSQPISAIAVYNINFGNSGHITEPEGLITENFRRCVADPDFGTNRRVKSIVKGKQPVSITNCSNVFNTTQGTVDEQGRPVSWGYITDKLPSFDHFRFNHYVCQSREYFDSFKSASGHADAGATNVRGEDWWERFNTNVDYDTSMERFYDKLKETIAWLMS